MNFMKYRTAIIYVIVLVLSMLAMHEITHYIILDYYGIEDKEVVFNFGYVGIRYTGECVDDCLLANSINEVVGYNVMPFLILICFIMIIKQE